MSGSRRLKLEQKFPYFCGYKLKKLHNPISNQLCQSNLHLPALCLAQIQFHRGLIWVIHCRSPWCNLWPICFVLKRVRRISSHPTHSAFRLIICRILSLSFSVSLSLSLSLPPPHSLSLSLLCHFEIINTNFKQKRETGSASVCNKHHVGFLTDWQRRILSSFSGRWQTLIQFGYWSDDLLVLLLCLFV